MKVRYQRRGLTCGRAQGVYRDHLELNLSRRRPLYSDQTPLHQDLDLGLQLLQDPDLGLKLFEGLGGVLEVLLSLSLSLPLLLSGYLSFSLPLSLGLSLSLFLLQLLHFGAGLSETLLEEQQRDLCINAVKWKEN